jgi:alpha-beta hydrolase superfamily lysophospholipase
MYKQFITEDESVDDAIQNISSHTGISADEAHKIITTARLRAAKQFGLPTTIAQSKIDPPNLPAGLWNYLENLFHKKVDLVYYQEAENSVIKKIQQEVVYG